ncbi:MAG: RelA/SpoT domain-containing protein, partial [Nanoarchaeota archaeon]|nr:RelA/SpoT domain-containing protein [Nanoarchaeota archaeon]
SKSKVDKAGWILINNNSTTQQMEQATSVLDNWRSAHSFPLHIFKKRLKWVSEKIDPNSLVVQRLKRTPAIINKLIRDQTKHMNLSQMQDIGGCRAVVSNIKQVKKLCEEYYEEGKHCDLKHEFKNKKDYITTPKPDGYRSIHLVYRYKSDKTKKYNGLLIEVQIRSKLQHYWATAIETVGHFTKQALKSNEGEEEWLTFFKLISTVFAKKENLPLVPDTPIDETDLYNKIKELTDRLQIIEKIKSWATLIKLIGEIEKKESHKPYFYLLELDIDKKELSVKTFEKRDEEKATTAYSAAEKNATDKKMNKDIVLVEADTTKELRKAYPNYFLDTKEFLSILEAYLKYSPKTK